MVGMAPDRMRDLAEDLSYVKFTSDDDAVSSAVAALRAAADQLEAVRSWLDGQDSTNWKSVDLDALDAILTVDTETEVNRDD